MTALGRFRSVAAAAALALLFVVACNGNSLRTYRVAQSENGLPAVCTLLLLLDPVKGTLRGDVLAQEPVWLEAADGRHLSVVWPDGFSVRFEPEATLYDEKKQKVASAGEPIEITQVASESAAGTFEDPYYAEGLLFTGCYRRAT